MTKIYPDKVLIMSMKQLSKSYSQKYRSGYNNVSIVSHALYSYVRVAV